MLFLAAALGLVIGALGGGGGVLTVPLLVYALGLTAQSATTSSIIIVGITALSGTLTRLRGKVIDWRTGLTFSALGLPAAYLGTLLNRRVDERVLLLAFAAVTVLAAAAMLINKHSPGPDAPCGTPAIGTVSTVTRGRLTVATKVVLSGLTVGFMTGFLGVGGGFLAVPALVIILRMPLPSAIGTSLLIITVNSASSLAARLGVLPQVDWRIVIPFTVLATAGSLLGKRVADRFSGDALTTAFAVMLMLVGGSVGADALGVF